MGMSYCIFTPLSASICVTIIFSVARFSRALFISASFVAAGILGMDLLLVIMVIIYSLKKQYVI